MRTIETIVYFYDELPPKIQEKARDNLRDINVDYDWWELVYEDASQIGLKLKEFDLGRASRVTARFTQNAVDVARDIVVNHGDHCETHKTAQEYLAAYRRLETERCQEEADFLCVPPQDEIDYEEMRWNLREMDTEDIDEEFLRSLCEDYRIILEKEYEYLTSDEAVIENIRANEYEFTIEGKMI